VLICTFI